VKRLPSRAQGTVIRNTRHARELLDPDPILDPVRKALAGVETHSKCVLQRWMSSQATPVSKDSIVSSGAPGRVRAGIEDHRNETKMRDEGQTA